VLRFHRQRTWQADVLEYLEGYGRMIQVLDARLERIVQLLEEAGDEPEDQS
jgi:hypothetical protein